MRSQIRSRLAHLERKVRQPKTIHIYRRAYDINGNPVATTPPERVASVHHHGRITIVQWVCGDEADAI